MSESIDGKKVFVTGADGFIGSHLVDLLVRSGASVRGLVYYNSWNERGWLRDLDPYVISQIEQVAGDIRDADLIRKSAAGCEYMFHLSNLS